MLAPNKPFRRTSDIICFCRVLLGTEKCGLSAFPVCIPPIMLVSANGDDKHFRNTYIPWQTIAGLSGSQRFKLYVHLQMASYFLCYRCLTNFRYQPFAMHWSFLVSSTPICRISSEICIVYVLSIGNAEPVNQPRLLRHRVLHNGANQL